ncbi:MULTISPECIES: hypothetical protein [unclassified Bradyrhizobium]|uniref:hypothetical protein n=1 Tax=unclassified Bradyrhizobium TaxID=2631580 RepID=UPI0028E29245|nr:MULTISPECIES: hypothetical protein [unclassified Bradyrhizobium]
MASTALCFAYDGFEFLGFGWRQLLQSLEEFFDFLRRHLVNFELPDFWIFAAARYSTAF